MTDTVTWTEHTYKVTDGTTLHYVEMGAGTPVVLIHGAGGSAVGNWFVNGIAPALAPTNRVVGIDMRGHGKSEFGPEGGLGLMHSDVIEFLDQQGIDRAHIGGYSMGGGVTLRLLASVPERFITASFGGSGIPELPAFENQIPADKEGADPEAQAAQDAYRRRPSASGEEVGNAGRARAFANMTEDQRAAFMRRRAEMAAALDLSTIEFPVLAVNGEYDRPYAKTHRMWRELPNFTNVILPGKGHLSAVMAGFIPQAYIDAMRAFITANNP